MQSLRRYGRLLLIVSVASIFLSGIPVWAHANLAHSSPAANAALQSPPDEIRLWFTEPLEPNFSRFTLLDSSGDPVDTPPSQVDTDHPEQMFMQPGDLPHGLYTVAWRTVSAADGHSTEGSFAFGIGVAVANNPVPAIDETVAPASVIIRWLNLLSLSLAIGSVGFWLFVWQPTVTDDQPRVKRNWYRLAWVGWLLVGVSTLLLLMLQVSTDANVTLLGALNSPALGDVLMGTAFGRLWLTRGVLWVLYGAVLWVSRRRQQVLWVPLALGGLILVTQSLFSHASAAPDRLAALANDWLHLTATILWIGGLAAFGLALFSLRGEASRTTISAHLVAAFSNYARVAVALLIVTGLYAAWLEVGSLDALLHTVYGQALLVKGILILPLLALAAVNLVFTQRGLNRGDGVWFGRLRGLVGAEMALTVGVLVAVGVMTSGSPARGVQALREIAANPPTQQPYFEMQIVNDQMIHLQIVPGYVGENQFIVTPFDENGNVITDASRIRLRFTNLDEHVGESELQPTLDENGEYSATGSNLSTPGHWRIRMTIARPGKFDMVVDFNADIEPAPAPPVYDAAAAIPLSARTVAALITGLALVAVGGFFAAQMRRRLGSGSRLLAISCLIVGAVLLVTAGVNATASDSLVVSDAWARPMGQGMTGGVYMTIDNHSDVTERLIAADSSIADSVALHQTTILNDIGRMRPVNSLDVLPGESVEFASNGYHLMLNNLHKDLDNGDSFPVTLTFASGKQIAINVQVRDNPP